MKNPYQRKAASKSSKYFITILLKFIVILLKISCIQRHVIALYHDGWALCATPTGQHALCNVAEQRFSTTLLIKDNWANYEIQEIGPYGDLLKK